MLGIYENRYKKYTCYGYTYLVLCAPLLEYWYRLPLISLTSSTWTLSFIL